MKLRLLYTAICTALADMHHEANQADIALARSMGIPDSHIDALN